jgi:3-oxoacyl-[acyl-carrier protein] reductase
VPLNGGRVLVTGGTKGIGRGIAEAFLEAEAQVVFCARSQTGAGTDLLGRFEGRAHFLACDLSDAEHAAALPGRARALIGPLDVVVHCAAVSVENLIEHMPLAEWQTVLQVNLTSALQLIQAAVPDLKASGNGRVIMVSSITGPRTALPGWSAYAASKGGLEGFVRAAAIELARDGITVNAVAPGTVLTEGLATLFGPEGIALAEAKIPAKRLGTPADIANAVLFFASPESSFITGQSLVADGGQTLVELF